MGYLAFRSEYLKAVRRKITALVLAVFVLAAFFYLFYARPRRAVPILMYHGISETSTGTLFVTSGNFERQMKFLRDSGYSVISLDELVKGIERGDGFRPRTVVITFDDGYSDNYLNAFPILAKYKMPATVFLVSGYVSDKTGYLNWDQVRLMASSGIDFGGHTRNDVYLPSVPDLRVLWDEIAGSKEDIEKNTSEKAEYFCYPSGGFDERIVDTVKKAGYRGACTTNRGRDRANRDIYTLNRVKITNSDMARPLHFRAKLSGYYNLFRRIKGGTE